MITSFDKAIAPIAIGIVLLILSQVGITENMTVSEAVTTLITAAAVWLVPNKA